MDLLQDIKIGMVINKIVSFCLGNLTCDFIFVGPILCPLVIMKMFYIFLHEMYTFPFKFNLRNYGIDGLLCTPILFCFLLFSLVTEP